MCVGKLAWCAATVSSLIACSLSLGKGVGGKRLCGGYNAAATALIVPGRLSRRAVIKRRRKKERRKKRKAKKKAGGHMAAVSGSFLLLFFSPAASGCGRQAAAAETHRMSKGCAGGEGGEGGERVGYGGATPGQLRLVRPISATTAVSAATIVPATFFFFLSLSLSCSSLSLSLLSRSRRRPFTPTALVAAVLLYDIAGGDSCTTDGDRHPTDRTFHKRLWTARLRDFLRVCARVRTAEGDIALVVRGERRARRRRQTERRHPISRTT